MKMAASTMTILVSTPQVGAVAAVGEVEFELSLWHALADFMQKPFKLPE